MSSRSKNHSKGHGSSSYYPTQWTEWEWRDEWNCEARYRLRGPDDYEYDYRGDSNVPRSELALQPELAQDAPQNEEQDEPAEVMRCTECSKKKSDCDGKKPCKRCLRHKLKCRFAPLAPQTGGNYEVVPGTGSDETGLEEGMGELQVGSADTRESLPSNHIRTRNTRTKEEKFDPHYKVHRSKEFQWGRIFKVLWAEPGGNGKDGGTGGTTEGTISVRQGKHGEQHHEKVRRFLIVNAMNGHCICLPINTYSGQGVNKKGVHAEHHTVIYTDKKNGPYYQDGEYEKGLIRRPILVDPLQPRHKLDPMSRLNYAKLYTVEYNVKVWFIGSVNKKSEPQITADYNHVHPPMMTPVPASNYQSYLSTSQDTAYAMGANSQSGYGSGPSGGYLVPPPNQGQSSYQSDAPLQNVPEVDEYYPSTDYEAHQGPEGGYGDH